jgi:circadian clock protein KaiB
MKIPPPPRGALKPNKPSRATRAFEKAVAARPEGKYLLRLYVAGATVRSRQALRRVYQLCEAEIKDNYDLEVIDVYQQPELARDNQIVATPTLVKEFPRPMRRFIGNLANLTRLFGEPELIPRGNSP